MSKQVKRAPTLREAAEKTEDQRRKRLLKESLSSRRTAIAMSPVRKDQPLPPQIPFFPLMNPFLNPQNIPAPAPYFFDNQFNCRPLQPIVIPPYPQPIANFTKPPQMQLPNRAIDQLLRYSPKAETPKVAQRRPVNPIIPMSPIPPPPPISNPAPSPKPLRFSPPPRSQHPVRFQSHGYVIYDKVLGMGTFSTVYLGLKVSTNTKVAIKEIKECVQAEIDIMTSVESEYILKMIEYWKSQRKLYIVLELCEGSLKDCVDRMKYQKAMEVFRQILEGVKCLHDKNIIHRDLKLENILIKDGKAKISDFGLAKKMGNREWVESIKCGTPCTMAPEVFFNSQYYNKKPTYNNKCDIWSLGVVLHELVYKRHPFNYDMDMFRRGQRIRISSPIQEVEGILRKCLVVSVEDRASAEELLGVMKERKQMKEGKESREKVCSPKKLDKSFDVQIKTEEKKIFLKQKKYGEGLVWREKQVQKPKQIQKDVSKDLSRDISKEYLQEPPKNPKSEAPKKEVRKYEAPYYQQPRRRFEFPPEPRLVFLPDKPLIQPESSVTPVVVNGKIDHRKLKEFYIVFALFFLFLLTLFE